MTYTRWQKKDSLNLFVSELDINYNELCHNSRNSLLAVVFHLNKLKDLLSDENVSEEIRREAMGHIQIIYSQTCRANNALEKNISVTKLICNRVKNVLNHIQSLI